ncbi:MAG: radical SAM protein [Desulfamplus sp.]|nr:radical SAM protein [Desulfamplus sp.]
MNINSYNIKNYEKHPCFNPDAKGKYGRVHLPVAPKCNIKCNFCDRKYDCVNESRPGVTSTILTPEQANIYVGKILEKEPRISVAGIAGTGDPFANPEETMATLRLMYKNYPELLLCVSSNGMGIAPYIDELAEIAVSHVTITVCAVEPEIGQKIYSRINDRNIVYRGVQGASLLLERQIEAIKRLKEVGITVKINCIVIPTINDNHVEAVAAKMEELGADLFNCMAMFPNVNTPFAHISQPDKEMMSMVQNMAEKYLPQMRHCTRCRADAVGLLENDRTEEFRGCLSSCSTIKPSLGEQRPYVAVATQEGILINLHLGAVQVFHIWEQHEGSYRFVEKRKAPESGGGITRWHQLAKILGDCRAVLVSGIGQNPLDVLMKSGIEPIEASGFIEDALPFVYEENLDEKDIARLKGRQKKSCSGGGCSGLGGGCG